MIHRPARRRAGLVALVGLAAACAGNGSAAAPPSTVDEVPGTVALGTLPGTVPAVVPAPTTLAPAPAAEPSSTLAPEPTGAATTVPPVPREAGPRRSPLTGVITTDLAQAQRPAVIVKIDNHPLARPQVGLDRADLVIEEIVEGITRFFAVYQSDVPDVVGPVRSARTQDALLVYMFGYTVFAWSGGNGGVEHVLSGAPLLDVSPQHERTAGQWFRDGRRQMPHNLFTKASGFYWFTPGEWGPPPALFDYAASAADVMAQGAPVGGVKLGLADTRVEWRWDEAARAWTRTQNGQLHRTADGAVVQAPNVVVLEVEYVPSAADPRSPEAQTVGEGTVLVFTGGRVVAGTWSRPTVYDRWELRDADGELIELLPGRTWVELAERGDASLLGS